MPVNEEEKQKNIKRVENGNILRDRDCTDCPCILVWLLFLIGWIVIISVAASTGKPERLIRPENFDGELCGDYELVDFPNLWIPKPSRLSYGLCTVACPGVGDYVCNNMKEPLIENASRTERNTWYTHTAREYAIGKFAKYQCAIGFNCTDETRAIANRYIGLEVKTAQYKCFPSFYASGATLYRCMPFQDERDNATLADVAGESLDQLNKVTEYVGLNQYANRGFAEMKQSWLVILLCALSACLISLVWIFLLRCLMKPIVYLCIILILALLIIVGYLAMLMADDLEQVKVPNDTSTEDQVKTWRAIQYICWILAAMYLILMVWMIKRIKIAIAIMREASFIFLSSPGLVVIPPIVFLVFIGWTAFFIITTVFIQTMETSDSNFKSGAVNVFGESVVNFTIDGINMTADAANSTLNSTTWEQDDRVKWLHAYNFFGFLWMSTLCIMYGFYTTAMVGASYYYSASQTEMRLAEEGKSEEEGGKEKTTEYFAIPRSAWNIFRYHFGTLLFGSFLIALIQFVRVAFLYFKEEFLVEWQESATVRCLICLIECCLSYIQKVVEVISKNSFIINCILNTNFCEGAGIAMSTIGGNGARVGVLAILAAVACFVLKVFIVGCNMIIAWALINVAELTEDRAVESGLFPLVTIFVVSFVVACVFVSVYESLVDTTLMAFLIDEEYFVGEFMPQELAELTDMFKDAETARREYESKLKAASNHKRGQPRPESASKKEKE